MSTVWIAHPATGGVAEVPETALPMYRQSGWDLLSRREVAAREQAAAEQVAAAEAAMRPVDITTSEQPPSADESEKESS